MARMRNGLGACVLGLICLLCSVLVSMLLWYLVDAGNFIWAYLTFLAMALCGCVGAFSLDGMTTILCLGVVRAKKPAGRALCAFVRAAVRGVCLLYQLVMVVMLAGEAMHDNYPLWVRLSALLVPAAVAAGNALLLRAGKALKAQRIGG